MCVWTRILPVVDVIYVPFVTLVTVVHMPHPFLGYSRWKASPLLTLRNKSYLPCCHIASTSTPPVITTTNQMHYYKPAINRIPAYCYHTRTIHNSILFMSHQRWTEQTSPWLPLPVVHYPVVSSFVQWFVKHCNLHLQCWTTLCIAEKNGKFWSCVHLAIFFAMFSPTEIVLLFTRKCNALHMCIC